MRMEPAGAEKISPIFSVMVAMLKGGATRESTSRKQKKKKIEARW